MAARVPLNPQNLDEHLTEQLGFLIASADSYDLGHHGEAKRMATNLRILFHDSRTSKSLLAQIGRLGGKFLTTAFPQMPGNVSTHGGLVMIGMKGKETRYLAMLDAVPYKHWLPFPDWWHEVVFVDETKREITRRDLILVAANQDGGAHIDPSLDATYHDLAKLNSLGWLYSDGQSDMPIPLPERAAIRQITHETLRTLRPGYSKRLDYDVDMVTGFAGVFDAPTVPPLRREKEPGRNELCPCGSGIKYKKCHGR